MLGGFLTDKSGVVLEEGLLQPSEMADMVKCMCFHVVCVLEFILTYSYTVTTEKYKKGEFQKAMLEATCDTPQLLSKHTLLVLGTSNDKFQRAMMEATCKSLQ